MLNAFCRNDSPWWLAAGTANACDILFYPWEPPGKAPGDVTRKDWTNSGRWDAFLPIAVLMANDPSMDALTTLPVKDASMIAISKADSLARFLMIRYPSLYRSLAASFREKSDTPRAGIEQALGFTLEELDEFWRRWILAQ
jgi:hypothetical protein